MGLEYVTGQINSLITELILRWFCHLIFTVLKILICFSLIKHFTNDHKRCSSHLQLQTTALGLKLVYSFINLIILLPATYVRDIPEVTPKDCQGVC